MDLEQSSGLDTTGDGARGALLERILRRTQPLPGTVPSDRVRALRRGDLVELVEASRTEEKDAWRREVATLRTELRRIRVERDRLEDERGFADALYGQERRRAEQLSHELATLREQVGALSDLRTDARGTSAREGAARAAREELAATLAAVEVQRDAEVARAARLEREVRELQSERIAARAERESERAAERARAAALEADLAACQASFGELWGAAEAQAAECASLRIALNDALAREATTRLQASREGAHLRATLAESRVTEGALSVADEVLRADDAARAAREAELVRDRATLDGALSTAREALERVEEELGHARRVQALAMKLGNLVYPRGADELRRDDPNGHLYADLDAAQKALRRGWGGVAASRRALEGVRAAVEDRAAGAARVEALRAERAAAEVARVGLERRYEQRGEALRSVERELGALQRELDVREGALTAARRELAAQGSELAALRREAQQLRGAAEARAREDEERLELAAARGAELRALEEALAERDAALQVKAEELATTRAATERLEREVCWLSASLSQERLLRRDVERDAMGALARLEAELAGLRPAVDAAADAAEPSAESAARPGAARRSGRHRYVTSELLRRSTS